MPDRLIAIGDIHGCLAALEAVLDQIDPQPDDTIVTLGDYVDRGMHSREVIERLMQLGTECKLMPLMGNHDEMLLRLIDGDDRLHEWLSFGGTTTLYSFGCRHPVGIPAEHVAFLRKCLPYYETEKYFFVHGSYEPNLPLPAQPEGVLRWSALRDSVPDAHFSGKTAVVGHTAQRDGQILDLGHIVCIDTCCYGGGWLTAMDVDTRQLWQADEEGKVNDEGAEG